MLAQVHAMHTTTDRHDIHIWVATEHKLHSELLQPCWKMGECEESHGVQFSENKKENKKAFLWFARHSSSPDLSVLLGGISSLDNKSNVQKIESRQENKVTATLAKLVIFPSTRNLRFSVLFQIITPAKPWKSLRTFITESHKLRSFAWFCFSASF